MEKEQERRYTTGNICSSQEAIVQTLPSMMDREIKEFVKEKETRKDYTIHHIEHNNNQFFGHNWVVVLKRKREYIYDWVILLPNTGFLFLPDCCHPTRNKIAYNWKEE